MLHLHDWVCSCNCRNLPSPVFTQIFDSTRAVRTHVKLVSVQIAWFLPRWRQPTPDNDFHEKSEQRRSINFDIDDSDEVIVPVCIAVTGMRMYIHAEVCHCFNFMFA